MERLTERDEFGNADIIGVDSADLQLNLEYDEFNLVTEALNRLASYEEIGMTPKEILQKIESLEMALNVAIARNDALNRAEYEGRLVVLPCKVGDTVYVIDNNTVRKTEVESIHQWPSGCWKISSHTSKSTPYWRGYEIGFESVFLTREAAEAALKERGIENA